MNYITAMASSALNLVSKKVILLSCMLFTTACTSDLAWFVTAPPADGWQDGHANCDAAAPDFDAALCNFGGTGGYVTAFSSAETDAARTLRLSAPYQEQVISTNYYGTPVTSFSLAASRIEYAHALNLTGAGEIIAVRDNGFNAKHEEFNGKTIHYISGYDADTITVDDHGTATAALAAGSASSGDTIGAAPGASLFLSPWDDQSDSAAVWDAASLNAIVQNNSWGLICSGDPFDECGIGDYGLSLISSSYRNALLNYAGDEGIVVFSASNENFQTQATYMAALPTKLPDLEKGWLTVINLARDYNEAASDQFRDRSKDIQLISSGCYEAARWCLAADGTAYVASEVGYENGTGTSYAAPRVSGAVALLAEAFPSLSASELRNRLLVTADNSFFIDDTDQISTLEFADNVSHAYHWVYGHGFLDVRAALLPIGTVTTTSANGKSISLDQPVIVGGTAVGNAIKTSLAGVSILATDAMGGDFSAKAETLAASYQRANRHAKAVLAMPDRDLTAERQSLTETTDWGFAEANGQIIDFDLSDDMGIELLLPTSSSGDIGTRLTMERETASGAFSLGLSHLQASADQLGLVQLDGTPVSASRSEIELGWGSALQGDMWINVGGLVGLSQPNTVGMIANVSDLAYSALSVDLSRENVLARGDRLTFFAKQPVAITSGTTALAIQTADADGKATLSELTLDLAPTARETEIGIEYRTTGPLDTEWSFGASHTTNLGHFEGVNALNVSAALQWEF